jgi:ribonuclease HI
VSDGVTTITTDGSCKGNPGPGGWAAILQHGSKEKELTGGEPVTTNNRMELMAAIQGLEALKRPSRVKVRTDSKYLIGGMTEWMEGWKRRNWKNVQNRDLWERLAAAAAPHTIEWEWVAGHSGDVMNERCDKLATAEADRARGQDEVRLRAELEAQVEIECNLAGTKKAEDKAPEWCLRGPGDTGVHCLTGDGKERCPHAFVILGKSKLTLRDRAGTKHAVETDETGKGENHDELRRLLRDL